MDTVTFELAAEELDQRIVESIKTLFRGNKIVITVAPKTERLFDIVEANRKDKVSYHIPADVFVELTDRVFEDDTFDIMGEFRKYKVEAITRTEALQA